MSLAGRPVLVTGADGFIGSHLVERLVAEGAGVRALCLYNSFGALGWLDTIDPEVRGQVEVVLGDVRDAEFVQGAMAGRDVVLHLAALVAIPYSYLAPRSFVETNVIGTLNVLQAARTVGVERVVHTSTSEVYGTPDSLPITEDHPLKGQSPYSASKIGADKLCEAWALSFGLPVVVLRPFNTYGPRQSLRAVIPTIVRQVLSGVTTLRLGSVHTRRDFTFVSDTVDGFVRAATAPLQPADVIQLGSGRAVSVQDIVTTVAGLAGVEVTVESDPQRIRPDASEVQVLLSDPTRAARLLGWKAAVSFEDGLARCVEWYRHHAEDVDATAYHR